MDLIKKLSSLDPFKEGTSIPLIFSLDLRAVGLSRILFGISILLSEYYIFSKYGFSISGYVVCAATAAFTVGFFTRCATVLTWLGFYYITATLLPVLDHGMIFARAMLFFGIFIPMGSHFSIDKLIKPSKGPQRIFSYPSTAWILQFFFVYFSAGITKSPDIWLWKPVAVHRILSESEFPTQLGTLLTQYPLICALLTVVTYLVELIAPFLLFFPDSSARTRTFVASTFIAFHIGLACTMRLEAFPFVCMALWVSILVGSRLTHSDEGGGESPYVTNIPPNIFHRFIALIILFMVVANIKTMMGDITLYEVGTPGWFFSHFLGLSQQWVMFNTFSNG